MNDNNGLASVSGVSAPTGPLETPSGKGAADENFPVGSVLLPARLRPDVAVFYAFARAADDIADNPDLEGAEKLRRLNAFEAALTGQAGDDQGGHDSDVKPTAMRRSLGKTDITAQHCIDLLAAFKQDAVKNRYDNWPDLIGYCELSANPVGRYLLDLHGEAKSGYPASDGLCSALQILNHLQDIKDDYLNIDRVYLPADWLVAANVTLDDLAASEASRGLRQVIDQCLDGTDRLLDRAEALPLVLDDWRLAMESAAILRLAHRLSGKLRRGDPIAERIEATKAELAVQAVVGAVIISLRRIFLSRRKRQSLAMALVAGK